MNQIATKINDDSSSPFFVSTKDKVSEILIKINVDSPFLQLASPLIQREILQRIYKYLSNGKTLSYETTCKLLSFTTQDIDISKKKKIMQLDKEILAIHLGNYLVFDVDGMTTSQIGTEIVDAETDDGSNLNETESEGIAKNGQCISYKSVTVTLDEVRDNFVFYLVLE